MGMVSLPPDSTQGAPPAKTNCFRPSGDLTRVRGLTAFTAATENLSPGLIVSPAVPVTTNAEPDWPAPTTVTPWVGAVPQVCATSEFERYHSQPPAVPITPLRNMRLISGAGLNCVTLFFT